MTMSTQETYGKKSTQEAIETHGKKRKIIFIQGHGEHAAPPQQLDQKVDQNTKIAFLVPKYTWSDLNANPARINALCTRKLDQDEKDGVNKMILDFISETLKSNKTTEAIKKDEKLDVVVREEEFIIKPGQPYEDYFLYLKKGEQDETEQMAEAKPDKVNITSLVVPSKEDISEDEEESEEEEEDGEEERSEDEVEYGEKENVAVLEFTSMKNDVVVLRLKLINKGNELPKGTHVGIRLSEVIKQCRAKYGDETDLTLVWGACRGPAYEFYDYSKDFLKDLVASLPERINRNSHDEIGSDTLINTLGVTGEDENTIDQALEEDRKNTINEMEKWVEALMQDLPKEDNDDKKLDKTPNQEAIAVLEPKRADNVEDWQMLRAARRMFIADPKLIPENSRKELAINIQKELENLKKLDKELKLKPLREVLDSLEKKRDKSMMKRCFETWRDMAKLKKEGDSKDVVEPKKSSTEIESDECKLGR